MKKRQRARYSYIVEYNIGDLIYWIKSKELSTVVDIWKDYDSHIFYEIETYIQSTNKYTLEVISGERIDILIKNNMIRYYSVKNKIE